METLIPKERRVPPRLEGWGLMVRDGARASPHREEQHRSVKLHLKKKARL